MPRIRQRADIYLSQDFTTHIECRLKELDKHKYELAEFMGISNGRLSQILQHPEKLSIEQLRKMAVYLELDGDRVLEFCTGRRKTA